MNCSRVLTAIGLALDLGGALLLWKYGLPEPLSRDGVIHLICDQRDDAEAAKARLYDRWATAALCSITAGFALQFIATFI